MKRWEEISEGERERARVEGEREEGGGLGGMERDKKRGRVGGRKETQMGKYKCHVHYFQAYQLHGLLM